MEEQIKHRLSDEEIDAIAERVCKRITNDLYQNAGKGIVGLVMRGVLLLVIGLAVYGLTGTLHIFK